jgi:Lrp/AsnC family transcriptional regulator, leucine-responsive regulatory protein
LLDDKDAIILSRLRLDSSEPISSLASELALPRTTIQERIRRLVKTGVIKRFTIQQDFAKLGKPVTAFILISFETLQGISQKKAAEELARIEDIYEVHIISGDWDILVKARGSSIESIGELVMEKIRNVKGVGRTLTCASFLSVKDDI